MEAVPIRSSVRVMSMAGLEEVPLRKVMRSQRPRCEAGEEGAAGEALGVGVVEVESRT
jgi:hypothetical protein